MACRADGAIMERYSQRNYRNYLVLDSQWDRQFIKLVPEQRTIEVDHRAREYESRDRVRGGLPWWDPTNKDCVKSASGLQRVGEETIAGVRSIKFEGSESKTLRTQLWLAPSLGCTQLKLISYDYNKLGLPISYFRREAKSVRLGEPDAGLFRAPTSYRRIR